MATIEIRTTYSNGSKPTERNDQYSSVAAARRELARMIRKCRADLNVIVFREGHGEFFLTTCDGVWEGTRRLRSVGRTREQMDESRCHAGY